LTFFRLLSEDQGLLYASLMIYPVVTLMWLISLKLYYSRKKVPYLSLSAALLIVVLYYTFIMFTNTSTLENTMSQAIFRGFNDSSFILLVFGFYQLYNVTSIRSRIIVYGICLLPLLIAKLFWVETILILLLAVVAWYLFSGSIGNDRKFQWAIAAFIAGKILGIFITEIGASLNWILFVYHLIPLCFYCILFFVLFERVLELMQSSYKASITDPLTGLYNRRFFESRLQNSINNGEPVSVIFSDIDNFKKLNDTKGHKAGDDVLKQVAAIFMEEIEGSGFAGRYGGEEMVILVTDPSINMTKFTETIRSRIEKETIVTASIGYSKYLGGVQFQELIKQADEAMYQAKTAGKNRVISYTP
jgi:diguanylate cyclase (GGDEF)-like protein